MNGTDQQQLGKTLWAIADQLRGAMNADDFRDYMLSFMFLRYLADNFFEFAAETKRRHDKLMECVQAQLSEERRPNRLCRSAGGSSGRPRVRDELQHEERYLPPAHGQRADLCHSA